MEIPIERRKTSEGSREVVHCPSRGWILLTECQNECRIFHYGTNRDNDTVSCGYGAASGRKV